jgi:hypothetical protein
MAIIVSCDVKDLVYAISSARLIAPGNVVDGALYEPHVQCPTRSACISVDRSVPIVVDPVKAILIACRVDSTIGVSAVDLSVATIVLVDPVDAILRRRVLAGLHAGSAAQSGSQQAFEYEQTPPLSVVQAS